MACCKKKRNRKWDNAGKDVIVLHAFKRTSVVPNLSPFALKLETYLRMVGLKYEFDSEQVFGPKGKTPWITLNGKDFGDSQLIMEMLTSQYDKNLNAHLTPEEAATSRAFAIMVDEHMFWGALWWRMIEDPEIKFLDFLGYPKFFKHLFPFVMRGKKRKRIVAQGIGVHSKEELVGIIKKDMKAASDLLGGKTYLLGNEPCEADCSLFGVLSQIVYTMEESPFAECLKGDYKNLTDYCYRIKEKYWSDWDELCKPSPAQ